jgi:hemolysin III
MLLKPTIKEDNLMQVKKYTLGEEIFNSISHGAGTLLSVAGMVTLIIFSALRHNPWAVVSTSIYGASLIILYSMSTLYHSLTNEKAKKFFQIMDHNAIFLLIAGTYTPYTLVALRHSIGWWMFGIVWAAALIGIMLNSVDMERFKKLSLICYIAMGWVIVFAAKPLMATMPQSAVMMLLIGGICYMGGVVFYVLKKVRYFHSVWHLFVLAGSIMHYFSILLMVIT